eukprot:754028_1
MAAQQTLEELVESENQPMLDYASAQLKPIVPSNAKTLIIVLGQCLEIDSGKADPTLIERCERAYKALNDFNLDLSTTYWIVSGSDVSNMRYKQKYGKLPEIRQASEAAVMKQIICNVYDNTNENKENNNNNNMRQSKKRKYSHISSDNNNGYDNDNQIDNNENNIQKIDEPQKKKRKINSLANLPHPNKGNMSISPSQSPSPKRKRKNNE